MELPPRERIAAAAAIFAKHPDDLPESCPEGQDPAAWELAHRAYVAGQRTAMADVAEHSRQERAIRKGSPGWTIGPSDAGRCPRAIQYRECPPDGYTPLPEDTRKADIGTTFRPAPDTLPQPERKRTWYTQVRLSKAGRAARCLTCVDDRPGVRRVRAGRRFEI